MEGVLVSRQRKGKRMLFLLLLKIHEQRGGGKCFVVSHLLPQRRGRCCSSLCDHVTNPSSPFTLRSLTGLPLPASVWPVSAQSLLRSPSPPAFFALSAPVPHRRTPYLFSCNLFSVALITFHSLPMVLIYYVNYFPYSSPSTLKGGFHEGRFLFYLKLDWNSRQSTHFR